MTDVEIVLIAEDDPRMAEVHALRHEALFAPFGIPRHDGWDDAGAEKRHVVALRDGAVVGYASLLLEDGVGHVRQVSVKPALHRGGVGRELMLACETEAVRLGLPLLWLNARITAEGFYHRLGYVTVSEGTFPSGRTGMPHVRMEKPLPAR